ncbi:MAG: acetyl-CoA carboxylase biotin carboxyl carrier protein [Holosporales bacterium]|jgi:acetyl-CoA carboxylase biotin carboxyl carrier protein|nr:acetyl-CoA carboxylase biotin carboxyl carrier protein [Holosporales bacterium]
MESKKDQIDAEAVRSLAGLLKETGLTEIEYQLDSLRIRVTKNIQAVSAALVTPAAVSAAIPLSQEIQPQFVPSTATKKSAQPTAEPSEVDADEGEAIRSPMVGVVYVAPSPGADPFVKVGETVSEGQTLLVIEAMKVMNMIKAPKSGTVTEVLVQDRQPVEYDEPLIIIV